MVIWTGRPRAPMYESRDMDRDTARDNPFDENGIGRDIDLDGPAGAGGSSGGSGSGEKSDKDRSPYKEEEDEDDKVSDQASRAAKRHGGALRAVEHLLKENIKMRRRTKGDNIPVDYSELSQENAILQTDLRDAERDIRDLRRRVPKEGDIVLTGENAKAAQEIGKLNIPLTDAVKILKEYPTVKAKADEADRASLLHEAAKAVGWNPDALVDISRSIEKKFDVEMKDVTVTENGTSLTKKLPHARPRGADDKVQWKLLVDYASEHFKSLLPALTAQGGAAGSGSTGSTRTDGIVFPEQTGGGGGSGGGDIVGQFVTKRNESAKKAPNPFFPAPATGSPVTT
jgi:hypothetical protein